MFIRENGLPFQNAFCRIVGKKALHNLKKHFIILHEYVKCNGKGGEKVANIPKSVQEVLEILTAAGHEA